MKENKIETEHVLMYMEGDILFSEFKEGFEVDLEEVKQLVKNRDILSGGKPFYSCMDITGLRALTRDARQYVAASKNSGKLLARAAYTRSAISAAIGNIFIRIQNPKVPTKLFFSKEKAIKWLNGLKIKELMEEDKFRVFDFEHSKFWYENDILIAEYNDKIKINLSIARKIIDDRLSITQGDKFLYLVNVSKIDFISAEARRFMASHNATKDIIAAAILAGNVPGKMIAKLFLQIDKPQFPAKLFLNKREALEWLKSFSTEENSSAVKIC